MKRVNCNETKSSETKSSQTKSSQTKSSQYSKKGVDNMCSDRIIAR